MNKQKNDSVIKKNKSVGNYEIIDRYEAGIVLAGSEVKSIREKRVSLNGAYCSFKGDELYIIGMRIDPYKNDTISGLKPVRSRKLLLKKRELIHLKKKVEERGYTIIPTKIYFSRQYVKVEIALAKGKTKYDKRQEIKKRDQERELARLRKHKS